MDTEDSFKLWSTYTWTFFNKFCKSIFSPYDFLNNMLFSLAYSIVRTKYSDTYNIPNMCSMTVYAIRKASGQWWAIRS